MGWYDQQRDGFGELWVKPKSGMHQSQCRAIHNVKPDLYLIFKGTSHFHAIPDWSGF